MRVSYDENIIWMFLASESAKQAISIIAEILTFIHNDVSISWRNSLLSQKYTTFIHRRIDVSDLLFLHQVLICIQNFPHHHPLFAVQPGASAISIGADIRLQCQSFLRDYNTVPFFFVETHLIRQVDVGLNKSGFP